MPQQKQYDRSAVLASATAAFWEHGYAATSISDLVAKTGLNRASLYSAFDGKHGLFLACLADYDRRHRQEFLEGMSRGHAPRDAILAAFEAAARPADRTGQPAGCLLVNSALEVAPHDPDVRALVNNSLALVEDFFRDSLVAGQADGTIPATLDPGEAAKSLLGLFVGLRVLVRSAFGERAVRAVIGQAEALMS